MRALVNIAFVVTVTAAVFSGSVTWAGSLPGDSVTVGPIKGGRSRIPLSLEGFDVTLDVVEPDLSARLVPDSLRWIRVFDSLLVPRALLEIVLPRDGTDAHALYGGTSHAFQVEEDTSRVRLHVSLFDTSPVALYEKGRPLGSVRISARKAEGDAKRVLIDYSCVPYGLEVAGLDDQYISVGCRLTESFPALGEKSVLEVYWIVSNYRLPESVSPPHVSKIVGQGQVKAALTSDSKDRREITIRARVPDRRHRLRLAYGLGPYLFDAADGQEEMSSRISPSLMLYGNYGLSRNSSIRAFEAFVFNRSVFSNFGAYYAYTASRSLDNRLKIVTLLGFQELSFKFMDSSGFSHDIIFPQGIEVEYSHAFGMENYHLIYGMFLLPSSEINYKNLWLRFGRKYFWELNYISWRKDEEHARMWGLSVGLPLARLF